MIRKLIMLGLVALFGISYSASPGVKSVIRPAGDTLICVDYDGKKVTILNSDTTDMKDFNDVATSAARPRTSARTGKSFSI